MEEIPEVPRENPLRHDEKDRQPPDFFALQAVEKPVNNFVENFGRLWKKVENYLYFCR
jgi:hypothetical protein